MYTVVAPWWAFLATILGLLALGYSVAEVLWTARPDPHSTAHFARARLVVKLVVIGVIVLALFLIAITAKVYSL